ncbi:hypothetical protein BLNAU_22294 [Blattamonas nauphoetae]|uniref:Serine-threonine/tyrosine-protein kinase catalytic domain-containing protein n=1 Tax=Blattamonas nauphoetae TaxID=2049346 RepID=A0ABQ9WWH7_9EUKA|nr:hypothetical protein BLNAU_22294 [Blattamonas nauphoetae]
MKLTGRNEEIPVEITTANKGSSGWVKAGGLNEIEFDKTYTIASLTKSSDTSEHIVSNGVSFITPAGPTLTDISADLDPSNLNDTILTLTAERIATGDLTLAVFDAADSTQKSIALGSVSFATSTTPVSSTISVVIRPSGKLAYGGTYKVKTLSSSSLIVSHSPLSFRLPSLLQTASCVLGLENPSVLTITISGIGHPPDTPFRLTIDEINEGNNTMGSPFTVDGTFSAKIGDMIHTLVTVSTPSTLRQGKRYEITKCEVTNFKTYLDGRVFFAVPRPPVLTAVPFSFASSANTSFSLVLEGTDLPAGETFLVTLKDFPTPIEVTFETTTTGLSAELPLGWSDSLKFNKSYILLTVVHKELSSISIPCVGLVLDTGTQPNPLILFVDSHSTAESRLCGDEVRPCPTIEVAWEIFTAYSSQRLTLKLITQSSLTSAIALAMGSVVKMETGDVSTPTLTVPSSASSGDQAGLVSIAGTLEMKEINIDVEVDDVSFVLFDVKEGKLVLDTVHITGISTPSEAVDGIEGLCEWETGLIKLHDSICNLTSCVLSSIVMGEIWMENSNVSLTSTLILNNGQHYSQFPSAQQDVRCHSGELSIVPSGEAEKHHWVSSSLDCVVRLNGIELPSPHFVPSIDGKKCTSAMESRKEQFAVSIVGTMLLPCNLSLGVSVTPKPTKSNDLLLIPLSSMKTTLWNETHISLSIPSSSLKRLDNTLEWKASLVFGNEKQTDTFVLLPSLEDRKSLAFQESLPWLIPVIACSVLFVLVIVVVIILIRRRQQKKKNPKMDSEKLLDHQELAEVEIKIEEYVGDKTTHGMIGLKSDEDGREGISHNSQLPTEKGEDDEEKPEQVMVDPVEGMKCEGAFPIEVVDGVDTLHHRLHQGNGIRGEKRREIERKIVLGMIRVVEERTQLEVIARISPHWILLNRDDEIFIRMQSELDKTKEQNNPSNPQPSMPSFASPLARDGMEEIRWRAPEQGEKEGELNEKVDETKAMVFRLGLVLWEVETGSVPFGELDAVSAHRHLAAGNPLPSRKIADIGLREVITQCLAVDPDHRPSLQLILSTLDEPQKLAMDEVGQNGGIVQY